VEAGVVSPLYSEVFDRVIAMRKMLEDKKIEKVTEREIYTDKEYVRRFVNDVRRFIEPAGEKPILEHKEAEPPKEKKKVKKAK
jgi:hypothetical protein